MFGSGMVACLFNVWMVSVAGTPEQIAQGLKGLHCLPFESGMWCNFGEDCYPMIDTTGMQFNLDIVFISSSLQVVDAYKEVKPDNIVASRALAQYCLQTSSLSSRVAELTRLGFIEEDIEDIKEDYAFEPIIGSSVFVVYFMLPSA